MPSSNVIFSVLSFIGFVLVCIPLSFHLQYKNVGTCMCMAWTGIVCLIFFINSIVWNDNVTNWVPVWCDITSHLVIGSSVGIPASSLSIMRRLYQTTRLVFTYQTQRRPKRDFYVELSIGVGLPCVVMILYYIVQTNRFNIYEQIGCYPATVDSIPTFLLLNVWPILLGSISSVYAILTFRMIAKSKSRSRMSVFLRSNGTITKAQYWRLMVLCVIQVICTVPIDSYIVSMSAAGNQVLPYSWDSVHRDFTQINQITAEEWHSLSYARTTYSRCFSVVVRGCGFSRTHDRSHGVVHTSCPRLPRFLRGMSFKKRNGEDTNTTIDFSLDDSKTLSRDVADPFHPDYNGPHHLSFHSSEHVPDQFLPKPSLYPTFPDPVWFPYHSDSRRSSRNYLYLADGESRHRRGSIFSTRNPSS